MRITITNQKKSKGNTKSKTRLPSLVQLVDHFFSVFLCTYSMTFGHSVLQLNQLCDILVSCAKDLQNNPEELPNVLDEFPGLTEDEIEDIRKACSLFDTDNSERIDHKELK